MGVALKRRKAGLKQTRWLQKTFWWVKTHRLIAHNKIHYMHLEKRWIFILCRIPSPTVPSLADQQIYARFVFLLWSQSDLAAVSIRQQQFSRYRWTPDAKQRPVSHASSDGGPVTAQLHITSRVTSLTRQTSVRKTIPAVMVTIAQAIIWKAKHTPRQNHQDWHWQLRCELQQHVN